MRSAFCFSCVSLLTFETAEAEFNLAEAAAMVARVAAAEAVLRLSSAIFLILLSRSVRTICLRIPFLYAILTAASCAIFCKRDPVSTNTFVCSSSPAISGFLTSVADLNSRINALITFSGIDGDCSIRRSSSTRNIFIKAKASIRSFG